MPTKDHEGLPAFSRGTESHVTELRGECPRQTVNVLDAVSMARNITRTALVNQVLGAWAEKVVHEATMVNRVVGCNPTDSGSSGGHS